MINFLAYPNLLLFWFLEPRIKCKRIFSSCVSLFSYQGSCLATAILDYHIFSGLSRTFFIFLKIYFFKNFEILESTALADSYVRIPQCFPFVNKFFTIFSNFFSIRSIPFFFHLYLCIFHFFLRCYLNDLTPAADSQPPEPFLLTLFLTIQIHCQPAADFLLFYIIMERFFYLYFLERNITGYPRIQYL